MLTIQKFLPTFLRTLKPEKEQFLAFQQKLSNFLSQTENSNYQGEEYEKGLLKEFLQYVLPNQKINTYKSDNWANIDLCVYKNEDDPEVIIESKSVNNPREMIDGSSPLGLNKKALHEAILYYLDLKISKNKNTVKTVVITNNIEWMIIDSVVFDQLCIHNVHVRKLYEQFNQQQNSLFKPKSKDFYLMVENHFINNPQELETLFRKSLHITLRTGDIEKEDKCVWFWRVFSENCLLKKRQDVVYALNKDFYSELLYIMGLEEEEKNKNIVRLEPSQRQENSIVEQVIEKLTNKGIEESQVFDLAMELGITWLNRILFIKLLEAQLINWHPHNSQDYKILSEKLIDSFDMLNTLFFDVLALPYESRSKRVTEKFKNVPYLNSSLFEETSTEKSLRITVGNLFDESICLYSKTTLKDNGKSYKPYSRMNILRNLCTKD